MIDDLKVGTVFKYEDVEYVIYLLKTYQNIDYIISLGFENPKIVKVFEYKKEGNEVLIAQETDEKIILELLKDILV